MESMEAFQKNLFFCICQMKGANMRTYYIAIISCLLALSCKYALAMDALVKAGEPSGDLSQSTLWAVQSIHAPDLFQQFGVSHSPSQWHLLNDDTVQAMFTNVGQKIGNSLLSERVQLSCLVARDMQKAQPAHDQKEASNDFYHFFKNLFAEQYAEKFRSTKFRKNRSNGDGASFAVCFYRS